jgi:hypothetical protein
MMKGSVQEAYEAAQGNPKAYEQHFELGGYLSKFEKWNDTLASLTPHTPQQTELLSSIRSISASFQQTRFLMSEQLASPISWPLLVIVVAWALLLFCGFGVMSGLNPTSVAALAFGAFAVATAIFLVLELIQPFNLLSTTTGFPFQWWRNRFVCSNFLLWRFCGRPNRLSR